MSDRLQIVTGHGRGSIGPEGNFCLLTDRNERIATVVYLAKSETFAVEYREEDGFLRNVHYKGVGWGKVIAILNTKADLWELIDNFIVGKYESTDLGIVNP